MIQKQRRGQRKRIGVAEPEQQPATLDLSSRREAVIHHAVHVIGDQGEAMRWLGTPVRALDYTTPISHLNDPEGLLAVLKVLTQLEHGVL